MFFDNATPTVQNRDLFGLVLVKYTEKCKEVKSTASLEGYLEFARQFLTTYPPVNIKYMAHGLGVQLSSGEVVAFTPNQLGMSAMKDEGLHIISTNANVASSYTAPSESIDVITAPKVDTPEVKIQAPVVELPDDTKPDIIPSNDVPIIAAADSTETVPDSPVEPVVISPKPKQPKQNKK